MTVMLLGLPAVWHHRVFADKLILLFGVDSPALGVMQLIRGAVSEGTGIFPKC